MGSTRIHGKNIAYSLNEVLHAARTSYEIEHDFGDTFFDLFPTMQLLFGFRWQRCLFCEKILLKTSAVWETNYWPNLFALAYGLYEEIPTTPTPSFPLTMEGLTLNLELDF